MFRQVWTIALVFFVALGSLGLATAQEPKEAGGTKQITNSIGMKLTLVPAGTFMMGSSAKDTVGATLPPSPEQDVPSGEIYRCERPRHRVKITKPFYLGTFDVTRGQFQRFVKDTGYKTDAEKFPAQVVRAGTRE